MVASSITTFTARWIFSVAAPALERGTITVRDDTIVAVEQHGTRTPDVDLGNVAILPGFVNAHTHLDLTGARGLCPPTPDFTHWLRQVIAFRRTRSAQQVQADIAAGLAECLCFGTTLIGDISAAGASWDLLGQSGCHARMFYELIGLSEERARQSWRDAKAWWMHRSSPERCFTGMSPHAPYSVHSILYQVLTTESTRPVATHLAETMAELELIANRSGPFVEFLKELNVWDPSGLVADPLDIIRMFPRGIFIHGNYLDPATPFTPEQTLIVCPRTHAAFGHPHHPFPKMNVRVALGTDSLASNPDLDILAEARFLRQHYPEVEPVTLLRMLTFNGAEALSLEAVAGSLTPGKSADLVVLPLPNVEPRDPHDLIFESALPVAGVMFRGTWLAEPMQNR